MSYYQPTTGHYGAPPGDSGYRNVDSGFSPVDPFKPSIEYSLQNIWSPETDAGPSRPTTVPHQPIIIQPPPQPIIIPRTRSSSPSSRYGRPRRRRRRSYSRSSSVSSGYRRPRRQETVVVQPQPIVVQQPERPRSRSPSENSQYERRRRRRLPGPVQQPVIIVQGRSASSSPSNASRHSRRRPPVQLQPTIVVERRPRSPSSPASSQYHECDEHQLSESPVHVVHHRRPSRRRRRESSVQQQPTIVLQGRRSSSSSGSHSPDRRRRFSRPVVQHAPTVVVRRRSRSRSSSDRSRSRTRRRRSRSPSLRHLPLVYGPSVPNAMTPVELPQDNRSPSPSGRRRVRVYSGREKAHSPETTYEPTPTSATESVLPSNVMYLPPVSSRPSHYSAPFPAKRRGRPVKAYILAFLLDTLPRQIYLHLLLRLPYLYFTRVIRILEEANMSLPQIKQNILDTVNQNTYSERPHSVIQYGNLEMTWGFFIDSLTKEWKTLNLISVLLLSTILAIINMTQGTDDPFTRFPALVSMIAALLSLIYGCMYNIRFQNMRKGYKAIEWAEECESTKTAIFWNVWVFLAMPATWLAWSLIFFVVCLISFIWRDGTRDDKQDRGLSWHQALLPRIIASSIFGIGFVYLILIMFTLRRYGSMMDQKWKARVRSWLDTSGSHYGRTWVQPIPSYVPYAQPYAQPSYVQQSSTRPPSTQSPYIQHPYPQQPYPQQPYPQQPYPQQPYPQQPYSQQYSSNSWIQPVPTVLSYPMGVSPPSVVVGQPQQYVPGSMGNSWQQVPIQVPPSYAVPGPTVYVRPMEKIRLTKLVDLSSNQESFSPSDEDLNLCQISREQWTELNAEILRSYDPDDLNSLRDSIMGWNSTFREKGGQLAVCEETGPRSLSKYAIYYFSTTNPLSAMAFSLDSISDDLRKLSIFSLE